MELVRFPSRGGYSVRSIILFCLTVLVTGLLWVLLGSTPVHAADANWSGDVILYDNHGYTPTTSDIDPSHGLPAGTSLYLYIPVVNGATINSDEAYFIYFAPGTDPPSATSAEYVAYDYDKGVFSNPHDKKTITLTLKGDESASSSCAVSGGLGWIICPITNFLAESMDSLFGILAGMIAVQPLTIQTGNDNGLYTAWNIMRNIANVAFVIAFLIIIYAQLTSMGVSNYGIKKVIPRLIVAAVLVNLSFYVSAVAIDISNVAGYSIQDIFNLIREQTFHITDDVVGETMTQTWTGLTAGILGSTGAIVGGLYIIANPASLFLLIPLLVTMVLTVLMVVVVLAARQAIIILLVIIAPLAFVANLLPNTEKLFNKWKDLFMTMLIFFPAFSLIFGGSQLAGQLIIRNSAGSMITVLFGMAVQIAPLIITPLILKLSGSLLGKVAQIVNNPKKGLLDRNKNWANDRATHARNRAAGRDLSVRPTGRFNRFKRAAVTPGSRMVQSSERRKRALKEGIEVHAQHADNRYKEHARHRGLHQNMAGAEMDKDTIANRNNAHIEHLKITPGSSLYGRTTNVQVSKDQLESAQNATTTYLNRQRLNSASPLHGSNLDLEASKSGLETSDNRVKTYIAQQRTLAGGALRHTVAPLEESKLHLEGAQNRYTAMVDNMKSVPGSAMSDAAFAAQEAKELAEAAQTHLQTRFDIRRRVVGSELNTSMSNLELTQRTSEAEKSLTAAYLGSEKLVIGSRLHAETVRAERAKTKQQVNETQVNKLVDEYKSGARAADGLLVGTGIVESMVEDVEQLAAETRGVQSAQNIQKQHIARAFRETDAAGNPTARANQLLTDAASVDPQGRVRAQSSAAAQLAAIEKEALTNNKTLIEDQASDRNMRVIDYVKELVRRSPTDPAWGGISQMEQEGLLEAAWDTIAEEALIEELHGARQQGSGVDQAMLNRVFARNGALKGKGGFDLATNFDLANATPEQIDVGITQGFGAYTAENLTGLPFAWLQYISKDTNLNRIISSAQSHTPDAVNPKDSSFYLSMAEGLLNSVTEALRNPEIVAKMGTKNLEFIKMHKTLYAQFGDSVNPTTGAVTSRAIDYDAVRGGSASPRP